MVLKGIQLIVTTLFLKELVVVALLQNLALGEHDDVIRVLDGGQAVGYDEHGADVHHLFKGILNQKLRFRIDVGGGLVEDHDLGLMNDGAGEGEELALAGGEVVTPLPHDLVQAIFRLTDEGVGVYVAAGLHDLLIGDVLLPEDDVTADGSREQEYILQHLAEVAAERGDLDLADINAVD